MVVKNTQLVKLKKGFVKLPEVLVLFVDRPRVPKQVRIDEENYAQIDGKKVKVAEDGSFPWTVEKENAPITVHGSTIEVNKITVVDEKEIKGVEKHLQVPFHMKKNPTMFSTMRMSVILWGRCMGTSNLN